MFRICATCLLVVLVLNVAVGSPTDVDANLLKLQDLVDNYRQDPIADPYPIVDFNLPLDTEFSSGSVSIPAGQIEGLSGLNVSLGLKLLPDLTISVNVTLPHAKITGNYISDITVLLCNLLPGLDLDILTLMGQGAMDAEINNVSIPVVVVLENIPGGGLKLRIKSIQLPITFDSVSANLENMKVNDALVDWVDVNPKIKPAFDEFWAENEAAISAALATIGSEIIKDCALQDIISGNLDCLNLPTPTSVKATCEVTTTVGATQAPGSSVIVKPAFNIMSLFGLILSAKFMNVI